MRAEQVEDILDLIPRRGQHAFDGFCDALEASDQERIVKDYLKPNVPVEKEQDPSVIPGKHHRICLRRPAFRVA